jgi:acetyl esterase/lipase
MSAFLIAGGVAHAQAAPPIPTPEIAATVVQKDSFPPVSDGYANGVRVLPGVRYWTPVGFRPLTMDIYLPPRSMPRPKTGFPVIMFIHGGQWTSGDSHSSGAFKDFPRVLADMSARGYVVSSVNYRLSGEAHWPAQGQDIKAAIKFLRLHADEYNIDSKRIVTWGVSAGGQLSAIAGVTCGASALQPAQPTTKDNPDAKPDEIVNAKVSDCVQGAVVWYGVFDMATIAEQARKTGAISRDVASAPEWRLLGCFDDKCDPEQIRSASPVSYVNADAPPMLLLVGDADKAVPYLQTMEMAKALKAADVEHKLTVLPDVDHHFIGSTHAATQEANQKALEETIRFIDRVIGTPRR